MLPLQTPPKWNEIGCERVVNFNWNAMTTSSLVGAGNWVDKKKEENNKKKKSYLNFFFVYVISVLLIFITVMEENTKFCFMSLLWN